VSEYEHNEHLLDEIQRLRESNFHLREDCEKQKQRIKRMEEGGDAVEERLGCGCGCGGPCRACRSASENWFKVKEAKL
jgi:hypothetical protein